MEHVHTDLVQVQMRWHAINSQYWSPQAVPLVDAIAQKLRLQTLSLLSSAYTSISVEKASSFLGCSAEELHKGLVPIEPAV